MRIKLHISQLLLLFWMDEIMPQNGGFPEALPLSQHPHCFHVAFSICCPFPLRAKCTEVTAQDPPLLVLKWGKLRPRSKMSVLREVWWSGGSELRGSLLEAVKLCYVPVSFCPWHDWQRAVPRGKWWWWSWGLCFRSHFSCLIPRKDQLSWLPASPSWSCQMSSLEPRAWSRIQHLSPGEVTLIQAPWISDSPALAHSCDTALCFCISRVFLCSCFIFF